MQSCKAGNRKDLKMSVIVKIIKAEKAAEKNATKRIVENAVDIVKEAKTIASLRAKYRGKEFATHMSLAGFSSLAERDQRNNLSAIVVYSFVTCLGKYVFKCFFGSWIRAFTGKLLGCRHHFSHFGLDRFGLGVGQPALLF